MARVATLEEIERHWSLYDVFDCHEALDIKDEIEAHAEEQSRRRQK